MHGGMNVQLYFFIFRPYPLMHTVQGPTVHPHFDLLIWDVTPQHAIVASFLILHYCHSAMAFSCVEAQIYVKRDKTCGRNFKRVHGIIRYTRLGHIGATGWRCTSHSFCTRNGRMMSR